jgi:AF2212-like
MSVNMSKEIEAIFRNGRIELPPDVQLSENTRVRVIVPEMQ